RAGRQSEKRPQRPLDHRQRDDQGPGARHPRGGGQLRVLRRACRLDLRRRVGDQPQAREQRLLRPGSHFRRDRPRSLRPTAIALLPPTASNPAHARRGTTPMSAVSPRRPVRRARLAVESLEHREVPATLVSPTTLTYQDLDGDSVAVTLSKPLLKAGNVNAVF